MTLVAAVGADGVAKGGGVCIKRRCALRGRTR